MEPAELARKYKRERPMKKTSLESLGSQSMKLGEGTWVSIT